jgi:hypothetical protein
LNKWRPERARQRHTLFEREGARLERERFTLFRVEEREKDTHTLGSRRERYTLFRVEGSGQLAPLARERKIHTVFNVPVIVSN